MSWDPVELSARTISGFYGGGGDLLYLSGLFSLPASVLNIWTIFVHPKNAFNASITTTWTKWWKVWNKTCWIKSKSRPVIHVWHSCKWRYVKADSWVHSHPHITCQQISFPIIHYQLNHLSPQIMKVVVWSSVFMQYLALKQNVNLLLHDSALSTLFKTENYRVFF